MRRPAPGPPGDFGRYWVASVASNLGDGVRLTAVPVLAAAITPDPAAVAAVTFAGWLPWLVVALPGGVLVDRVDRRALMVALQVARLAIASALTLVLLAGLRTLAGLGAVVFAMGACEVLFASAAPALLPALVERGELPRANARLFAGELAASEFVGPPLGGLLFSLAAPLPFAFDAVTFGAGALLLRRVRGEFQPAAAGPWSAGAIVRDAGAGLAWLWRSRLVRTLTLADAALNLSRSMTVAIFVLFALHVLRLSAFGFGVLWTATAAGALAGSLLMDRVRLRHERLVLVAALLVDGASTAAIAFTDRALAVAVATAVFGFATMVWNVISASMTQAATPNDMLGRVSSAQRFLSWGCLPAGAALGGVVAHAYGLAAPFLAGGLLVLAIVAPAALQLAAGENRVPAGREAGP